MGFAAGRPERPGGHGQRAACDPLAGPEDRPPRPVARLTSPSSARIVTAVNSPTPKCCISALQPNWRRAYARSSLSSGASWASSASIIPSATTTGSRAPAGRGCALSHRSPSAVIRLPRCGHPGDRAPPGSVAATRRAGARACGAEAPESADRGRGPARPRLRQPSDHQQLAHVARVGAVALGALLVPAPGGSLSRLREMHDRARTPQLLGHEPPAGRRLQRDLELLTTEPLGEPAHARPVRRRDPRPRDLTGLGVDPLRGDLRSVLIQTHYDRHLGPPQVPRFASLRGPAPRLSRGRPTREPGRARRSCHLSSHAGHPGRRPATEPKQVSRDQRQPALEPARRRTRTYRRRRTRPADRP
jgi:hypothetical protein